MLVMKYKDSKWENQVLMELIYVPTSNTKLVKEILEKETSKDCNKSISRCFGPETLQRYRDRILIENLDECVTHDFDKSWWNESNFYFNEDARPKS